MDTRITTLTLNPAIDVSIFLNEFILGAVNRPENVFYDVGGKGVNVAACLAQAGFSVNATGVLGKIDYLVFDTFFKERKINNHFLKTLGKTRENQKIITKNETTDINFAGIGVNYEDLIQIRQIIKNLNTEFLVLAGSLPPNCPEDIYLEIIKENLDKKIILDCSGNSLNRVLSSGILPFCIKPNKFELEQYLNKKLNSIEDILLEAKKLNIQGINLVIISLGEEGALFSTHNKSLISTLNLEKIKSTVGAGDAMLAGVLVYLLENSIVNLEYLARKATAFAVGKLMMQGANLPSKDVINNLIIQTKIKYLT